MTVDSDLIHDPRLRFMAASQGIKSRTGDGRARAKARGVHMGRPPKLTPHQKQEAIERRERGDTLTDIARTYGVAHTTIARLS